MQRRNIMNKHVSVLLIVAVAVIFLTAISSNAVSYTLKIHGNANMDESINDEDLTYLEKVIKGDAEKTELSDANNDGVVDEKDIEQIKKIIAGDEGFLVVQDDAGRTVRVDEPIESFVYHGHNIFVYETLRAIGVSDKIIGVNSDYVTPGLSRYSETYFPELLSVENLGGLQAINYEVINNIKPDLIVTDYLEYYDPTKTPDFPTIALDVNITNPKEATMRYGYIFGKVSKAEEYISWINDQEKIIKDRINGIPESERSSVYVCQTLPNVETNKYASPAKHHHYTQEVRNAGGLPINDEIDIKGTSIDVDAEWIVSRNPQAILLSTNNMVGYDAYDPKNVSEYINAFLQKPELANVEAVKNKRVYIISHAFLKCGGASGLLCSLYYAKWLYPDLFADVDVQAIHQEYVSKFQHLDIDVKKCIMAYPLPT
jgi:iron complex transport system substrate-binding protein